jgi:hypothetical protein
MYVFGLCGNQWYSVEIELGPIGSPIYSSDYLFHPFGSPEYQYWKKQKWKNSQD